MRHGYSLSTFLSLQNCRWTPFSESSAETSSKAPDSASYCEEFKILTLEVCMLTTLLRSSCCFKVMRLTLLPGSSQAHSAGLAAPISASAMEGTLFFHLLFFDWRFWCGGAWERSCSEKGWLQTCLLFTWQVLICWL